MPGLSPQVQAVSRIQSVKDCKYSKSPTNGDFDLTSFFVYDSFVWRRSNSLKKEKRQKIINFLKRCQMIYFGAHFHDGDRGIPVTEEIKIMEKLANNEVVPIICEGYWKVDLQFSTPIIQKSKDGVRKIICEAQAVGVIPARISRLNLFEKNIPIMEVIKKIGYKSVEEMQEFLFRLNRPKPKADWFSLMFFVNKDLFPQPEISESHYHWGEPVSVYQHVFKVLKEGQLIGSIEEGYRIFNLDRPQEVRAFFGGGFLGYGEVIPFNTRLSRMNVMRNYLPIDKMLKTATGRDSTHHLNRHLMRMYPDKHDLDWVTVETLYILDKSKYI